MATLTIVHRKEWVCKPQSRIPVLYLSLAKSDAESSYMQTQRAQSTYVRLLFKLLSFKTLDLQCLQDLMIFDEIRSIRILSIQ